MTFRAILIGLVLGLGLACFGYFNDWVIGQVEMATDLVPVGVYGLLVLGLLIANPLLRAARRSHFRGAEWCVIVSLMLVACVIPGPGLMANFSNTLVMPEHFNSLYPGWRRQRLLDYVPPVMLVHPGDQAEKVVDGFILGLEKGKWVGLGEVPWSAWAGPLSFWLPLMGLSFVAGICLVLIVHKQWAHREKLRYPVADFASELIRGAERTWFPRIFYDRRFWLGFAPVLAVLLINGAHTWELVSLRIPLEIELGPVGSKWPSLYRVPNNWCLLRPRFYFGVIGFAYFVSTDVSFSLGISQMLFAAAFLALTTVGVEIGGGFLSGGPHSFQLFGAYLGLGLMILYGGRRFYTAVLLNAFAVPTKHRPERGIVWACRVMLLAGAAMVLVLVGATGLNWLLACLFVLLTGLMFLLVTRISVETGLFFVQPSWYAVAILLGLFGMNALGPNMLIILALLSMVIALDPRICLMPLVANATRFSEAEGLSPPRLGRWLIVGVLIFLVAGVPSTIYVQYVFGGGIKYQWANTAATYPFEMLSRNLGALHANPDSWQGLSLSDFRPDGTFLLAAGIGLFLAVACSAMRLRYLWWPIHPILFLVWGTFPMAILPPSFLLGWAIKVVLTRLGGTKAYHRSKPLFVGMVAGEFVAAIFWMVFGLIYFLQTGVAGPRVRVHP